MQDFATLVRQASHGDLAAQQLLCHQYEPKVRIVARVLLGPALRPHFDSMDIVQSVHRSLLVGLRDQRFDISSPDKLIALASTLARRKVARKWRRESRPLRSNGQAPDIGWITSTLSSLSSPDANPARVAEYNDQISQLCSKMNETERRMLQLRLEGRTSPEVAHELGLHPVAVRVRWTRLRQRLQDAGVMADWM